MPGKREDYISWDTYFMLIALASRERSKDPRTRVGAVIVKDHKIISVGYNGTPRGIDDDEMPWDSLGENDGNIMQIKNTFVVHAEANALNHVPMGTNLEGSTMYVTLFPCNECAKRIVDQGIKEIVYLEEYKHSELAEASRYMFAKAGINVRSIDNLGPLSKGIMQVENQINDIHERKLMKIKNPK